MACALRLTLLLRFGTDKSGGWPPFLDQSEGKKSARSCLERLFRIAPSQGDVLESRSLYWVFDLAEGTQPRTFCRGSPGDWQRLLRAESAPHGYRFISFYEALKVNSAVTHLMGFLVLLATVQLWDILRHNAQFQVISKTLNKAWDEVVGFILLIVILLSSYAMTVSPKAQHLPQVQNPVCALRKHHCS